MAKNPFDNNSSIINLPLYYYIQDLIFQQTPQRALTPKALSYEDTTMEFKDDIQDELTTSIVSRTGDDSQSNTEDSIEVKSPTKKRSADSASLDTTTDLSALGRTAKKICLEKPEILRFLESVIEVDLSSDVLTDIVYKQDGTGKFTVVGRPKVTGSSTKQMRHITPYSFIEKLISKMVKSSLSINELFDKLSNALVLFPNDKTGFCFNSQDLQNSPYKSISSTLKAKPDMVTKSLFNTNVKYSFVDTSYSKELFTTPTKKAKATKEFGIKNTEFIQASLAKLKNAIGDQDHNTSNIANEALARFMFILFNQQKYAAFPKEGNTLEYEIRLYDSLEDAADPKEAKYEVMTSREVKKIIDEGNSYKINKCIRIVNCEGSKSKEIYKGLVTLDNLINKYNFLGNIGEGISIESLLKIFNTKYNFYLKLANVNPDLSKYNDDLNIDSYKENIAHQTAKLLYYVFDFKALEDNVFAPKIGKKSIKVYNSATGLKTAKYAIKDGNTYRKDQKNEATGYNDEVTFRSSKTKLDILAQKAVQHLYIALMPFDSLYKGFKSFSLFKSTVQDKEDGFIKTILDSFAHLIKLDYALNHDQEVTFDQFISEDFTKILELGSLMETSNSFDVTINGGNYSF